MAAQLLPFPDAGHRERDNILHEIAILDAEIAEKAKQLEALWARLMATEGNDEH